MLGSYKLKLSYYRVIRLVSLAPLVAALMVRLGSLKQATIKAKYKAKYLASKKIVINFSYLISFITILE